MPQSILQTFIILTLYIGLKNITHIVLFFQPVLESAEMNTIFIMVPFLCWNNESDIWEKKPILHVWCLPIVIILDNIVGSPLYVGLCDCCKLPWHLQVTETFVEYYSFLTSLYNNDIFIYIHASLIRTCKYLKTTCLL